MTGNNGLELSLSHKWERRFLTPLQQWEREITPLSRKRERGWGRG